jgi:hypothetical protein
VKVVVLPGSEARLNDRHAHFARKFFATRSAAMIFLQIESFL